jgi:hypothetical protein
MAVPSSLKRHKSLQKSFLFLTGKSGCSCWVDVIDPFTLGLEALLLPTVFLNRERGWLVQCGFCLPNKRPHGGCWHLVKYAFPASLFWQSWCETKLARGLSILKACSNLCMWVIPHTTIVMEEFEHSHSKESHGWHSCSVNDAKAEELMWPQDNEE